MPLSDRPPINMSSRTCERVQQQRLRTEPAWKCFPVHHALKSCSCFNPGHQAIGSCDIVTAASVSTHRHESRRCRGFLCRVAVASQSMPSRRPSPCVAEQPCTRHLHVSLSDLRIPCSQRKHGQDKDSKSKSSFIGECEYR